ncbi:MAG TPA: hypothetical protein VMJ70_00800 [Candidatus Sulfotelmatobacter sp.]|nr:hypothetical protein [Candidatus Sulfotelmatobacter sp.]
MFHRYLPIALAALVSVPAGAGFAAAAAPIPVDSLQVVDLPRYKLYGPDIASLQLTRHEMDYAFNQFRRYIGDSPPKLTIAVLGSLPDPSRVSAASLREAGVDYVLTDWPPRAGAPPPAPELSERAGRWYLAAFERVNARASPPPGKARLTPDWFDSAVAGLCASPVEQGRRLGLVSAHIDQHIPIDRLLAMSRPEPGPPAKSKGQPANAAKSGGKSTPAAGKPAPAGATGADAPFYDAEALSFARFLAMREGDRFIGWVLEPILAGEPASAGLNRAKTLFPRPDQLETAWVAWVKGGMKNEAPQQ